MRTIITLFINIYLTYLFAGAAFAAETKHIPSTTGKFVFPTISTPDGKSLAFQKLIADNPDKQFTSEYVAQKYKKSNDIDLNFVNCEARCMSALESVWPKVPLPLRANSELGAILFADNLASFGLTMDTFWGVVVVLNNAILDSRLEELDNKKLGNMFGDHIRASYEIPEEDEPFHALYYILVHELAHAADHCYKYTGLHSVVGISVFDRLSWKDKETSLFDESFKQRSQLLFRRQASNFEKVESQEILQQWMRTNFSTLYGAMSPEEDFAETFAFLVASSRGWKFQYLTEQRSISLNERFAEHRFLKKRGFIGAILGFESDEEGPETEYLDTLRGTSHSAFLAKLDLSELTLSVRPFLGGTAFAVSPTLILTNYHVIRDKCPLRGKVCPEKLEIQGASAYVETVVARPDMDFAVLRLRDVELANYLRTNLSFPRNAEIFTLGYPGFHQSGKILFYSPGRTLPRYNPDVAGSEAGLYSVISKEGASGSPIFNGRREVVGLLRGTFGKEIFVTGATLENIEKRTSIFSKQGLDGEFLVKELSHLEETAKQTMPVVLQVLAGSVLAGPDFDLRLSQLDGLASSMLQIINDIGSLDMETKEHFTRVDSLLMKLCSASDAGTLKELLPSTVQLHKMLGHPLKAFGPETPPKQVRMLKITPEDLAPEHDPWAISIDDFKS